MYLLQQKWIVHPIHQNVHYDLDVSIEHRFVKTVLSISSFWKASSKC